MFRIGPVALEEPGFALAALGVAVAVIAIAIRRRIALPPASRGLMTAGLLLLILTAGAPTLERPEAGTVDVMVDLSPSTRGARYRDQEFLRKRLADLLGGVPHRVVYFADGVQPPAAGRAGEIGAEKTRYVPAAVPAVVLFSDAQFSLPATAPATYVVVDPLLESPPDASVTDLQLRGEQAMAVARNQSGEGRTLMWLSSGVTRAVPSGSIVVTAPTADSSEIAVRLDPGDLWPENDGLRIYAPPPERFERWWLSVSAAPEGWRRMAPEDLPADPSAYLAASLVAADNIPAEALSEVQQERLRQYVRDLGGPLLVLGGDRAFAAGAYTGSALGALSPLSSAPPTPTTHWLLLADASGSMAAVEEGRSRWDLLRQSLRALLPHLPPSDPVSVGSFAENLRWWSTGRSAAEIRDLPFPEITPHGPTNLEPALAAVISQADAAMPKELLLVTDGDAELTRLDEIEQGLRGKRIRLHLLALRDDGRALGELERLVEATGGQSLRQLDPGKWTEAIRQLFQQVAPDLLIREPTAVTFLPPLDWLIGREVTPANRTWLKPTATLLAQSNLEGEQAPMAAQWNVGAGVVLAAAFQPTTSELGAMAAQVERPPRDPRFSVQVDAGADLVITVDAVDGDRYLNGLDLALDLTDLPPLDRMTTRPIPQSGPGRYRVSLPAPRHPSLATVRQGERILSRCAVAGRYAPEFEAIGNNHRNMRELAARTGGAVIPPTQTTPIQFDFPRRAWSLTPWAAAGAALLLVMGLIRWRLG